MAENPFGITAENKSYGPNERQKKSELPMDRYRDQVIECISSNDSSVIIGETGSGKTTRIPVYLLESMPDARVAITQPRRVAARSVARYVASEMQTRLGDEVGFQVRFEDQTTEGTRANFMTDGILLRKLQNDPLLREYDAVMVDEAHERSLNIDLILGLLKRTQVERKKVGLEPLKVIVTSATIEKEKFTDYFTNAPSVEVPGRMFPVDVVHEAEEPRNYMARAAQITGQIVNGGKPGDILIFMPGEQEIRQTIDLINQMNLPNTEVMSLFGAMAPEDQDKIFGSSAKRKVIVSTNIAETSVTIDGVRFVIDSGLIKQKEFDPNTGIDALVTTRHAKSGCRQRMGRAGRTAPGACYRLYTANDFDGRKDFQKPEIARSDLDHVVLTMKIMGIDDVSGFDFIDPPAPQAISQAIDTLKMLGALNDNEQVTNIGELMAELPLKPEIARMVLEARKYKCVGKICTLAAMLGEKSVFVRPKDKEAEADRAHARFKKGNSDFLALLEVWNQWEAAGFDERWACDNFLHARQLKEIREIRFQLIRALKQARVPIDDGNGGDTKAIERCITSGLIQHFMQRSGRFSYSYASPGRRSSGEIFIHPSSVAFGSKPDYMIGANVMVTKKPYARLCQPVDLAVLPEIAPQILTERGKSNVYDAVEDSIKQTTAYSLRGSYSTITSQTRVLENREEASEIFIKALAEGVVDMPCVIHNQEAMKTLQALRTRTGGAIMLPDLSAWYQKEAGGSTCKKEAIYIDERLKIKIEDYCPPERLAEIDALYPETIMVAGREIKVVYEYKQGNPNSYYESDRHEKYTATILLPNDLIFNIGESDIPQIGENGRPAIVYKVSMSYETFTASSLEQLQEQCDAERIKVEWREFSSPERKEISVGLTDSLPEIAELGFAPIKYATDRFGRDVYAIAGYCHECTYDYNLGNYQTKYFVQYYPDQQSAEASTNKAIKNKIQDIHKENRRIARETLLEPAKMLFEQMNIEASDLNYNYQARGFTYDEYQKLYILLNDARNIIHTTDADPVKALELLGKIKAAIEAKEEERQTKILQIESLRTKYDELLPHAEKITYSTYQKYGLSYDQYNDIQKMWNLATESMRIQDSYGKPVCPNPEDAERALRAVESLLPGEQTFTREQEALIEIMTGKNASYAMVLRVRGGKVAEACQARDRLMSESEPELIRIGGSGRSLKPRGSRVFFVYGSGREEGGWQLNDGDYLFSRDGSTVLRVEENSRAPFGLQAVEFVEQEPYEEAGYENVSARTTRPYYQEAPAQTGLGAGLLADKLKGVKPAPVKETKEEPKPAARTIEQPAREEKMTEDLRAQFLVDINAAETVMETALSASDTDKKDPRSPKIAKLKIKAKGSKKELLAFKAELSVSDNAERMRGKTAEFARRADAIAKEYAKLFDAREDWHDAFKRYVARLLELAAAQEVELDETAKLKIKNKLLLLSRQSKEPDNLDAELESILIDSL